jgi:SAM-dependent methyltransferase
MFITLALLAVLAVLLTVAISPLSARRFIDFQTRLSGRFDHLLPEEFRIDGNREFLDKLVPAFVPPRAVVYDVGGGKNPVVAFQRKSELGLRVIGLDIDGGELAAAPVGSYDETVCADITGYQGQGDGDLVICQALLEHVCDSGAALRAISSILKPGGRALIFVPSRNAVYARVNLLLPEALKRKILFAVFPETRRDHGFRAFYDRCTPVGFAGMAVQHGLLTEHCQPYFQSSYFRFCFPLHAAWRLWMLLFRLFAGRQAAETFTVILRKQ